MMRCVTPVIKAGLGVGKDEAAMQPSKQLNIVNSQSPYPRGVGMPYGGVPNGASQHAHALHVP
jgi:hypothetical protein